MMLQDQEPLEMMAGGAKFAQGREDPLQLSCFVTSTEILLLAALFAPRLVG
jgi:hypothetical protein